MVDRNVLQSAGEIVTSWMAEALMPKVCGGAGEEVGGGAGRADGVEVAGGITSEKHLLGTPVQMPMSCAMWPLCP